MYRQLMPGVFVGVPAPPVRALTDEETLAAAREWLALRAALDLAPEATAAGVVTELQNLRAEVVALARLCNEPRLDGGPVAYVVNPDPLCGMCLSTPAAPGQWVCAACALAEIEVNYG